jgi:hypothetical protein
MQAFNKRNLIYKTLGLDCQDDQLSQNINQKVITYRLSPSPFLSCFISILDPSNSDVEGQYHIRLFNTKTQQFYCYVLNRSHYVFELNLFDNLHNQTEADVWDMLLKHGDFIIDCDQTQYDVEGNPLSLADFTPEQTAMLNKDAVELLDSLGIGIMASLYHWLIEPRTKQAMKLRQQALKKHTVFLMCKVAPSATPFFDNPHHAIDKNTFVDLDLMKLNQAILKGLPLAPIIAKTFNFNEAEVIRLSSITYARMCVNERSSLRLHIIQRLTKVTQ